MENMNSHKPHYLSLLSSEPDEVHSCLLNHILHKRAKPQKLFLLYTVLKPKSSKLLKSFKGYII